MNDSIYDVVEPVNATKKMSQKFSPWYFRKGNVYAGLMLSNQHYSWVYVDAENPKHTNWVQSCGLENLNFWHNLLFVELLSGEWVQIEEEEIDEELFFALKKQLDVCYESV